MTEPRNPVPNGERPFDLVVFGATGFTGRLVAEYLARSRPRHLRWAIAGRDRQKLAGVKAELVRIDSTLDAPGALEVLTADSGDRASLDAVARAARVIATTVGPYRSYGRELTSACAENGTHYADLTGEVPFIRESIDRNDARARETGARIVHSAGFDSIPSDLGVFMLHQHFSKRSRKLARASFFCEAVKAGLSGGTVASMTSLMEGASGDRELRRLLTNPYALTPQARQTGPNADRYKVRFEPRIGKWVCPFIMAQINTRNVHRSNALLDYAYGRDFAYSEEMCTGAGPVGFARAAAVTGGLATFATLAATKVGRRAIKPFQPAPGEGPSLEQREAGFFKIRIIGESDAESGSARIAADAEIHGQRDPGYGETALMLSESALCLAFDPLDAPGGVLTPSVAMGAHLLERLRGAGMTFRVIDRAS